MQSNILKIAPKQIPAPLPALLPEGESDAALSNRIEALRMLAIAILKEIDALRETRAIESVGEFDLKNEVHRFEAENIRYALIRTGGRQRRAARLLNMKVATLNAKIKRYQIDAEKLI